MSSEALHAVAFYISTYREDPPAAQGLVDSGVLGELQFDDLNAYRVFVKRRDMTDDQIRAFNWQRFVEIHQTIRGNFPSTKDHERWVKHKPVNMDDGGFTVNDFKRADEFVAKQRKLRGKSLEKGSPYYLEHALLDHTYSVVTSENQQ